MGVDDQIEQMHQRMLKILSVAPSPESPGLSRKHLESLVRDLREANEQLVIASLDAQNRETKIAQTHQRQSLFLSMLAHELRNPLASITMSLVLLKKEADTPPASQILIDILSRQTSHLSRLVEDLMDATRIESGKIKILKSPVLLAQVIAQAVETSLPLLDGHHQPVVVELPLEPVWINGDVVRLTQMFCNLIINASKFSADHKPVRISAQIDSGRVRISVKDEGIGIAPELQPLVFDLFMQGPAGDSLIAAGLGIGLSLVRTLAQLHDGSVELISKGIGQGSEFIVTLPVTLAGAPLLEATATEGVRLQSMGQPASSSKRILLIDDNADINLTLSEFLTDAGHEVESALDGATGLRMESLHPYEVICCDIGMPGMNGYEVAKSLRRGPSTACLIAISGYEQPQQRARAQEAGFDHYLVKPIFGPELLGLIDHAPNVPIQ